MSRYDATAYLMVVLDKNGNRIGVRIFGERQPTMSFANTAALIMEYSAPTYHEAREGIIKSLRSMGRHREWILRELGESLA